MPYSAHQGVEVWRTGYRPDQRRHEARAREKVVVGLTSACGGDTKSNRVDRRAMAQTAKKAVAMDSDMD